MGNCRYLAGNYPVVFLRIHFRALLEGKKRMTSATGRWPGLATKAVDE